MNKYQQYELEKRQLQEKNLTKEEYEEAIKELAERLEI